MSDQDATQEGEGAPEPTPNKAEQIDLDALAEKIAMIQNEKGQPKYDSIEKAIESLQPKEEYIRKLEEENRQERELRKKLSEQLEEAKKAMEVETKLQEKLEKDTSVNGAEQPSGANVDEETLANLVAKLMEQENEKKTRQQNQNKFKESIKDLAEDTEEYLEKAASKVGLSKQYLLDIAAHNPDAARILISGEKEKTPSKLTSNVNTTGFQQPAPPKPKSSVFKKSSDQLERIAQLRAELSQQQ